MQINRVADFLLETTAPGAVIMIRLLTGSIFLSEGTQELQFPSDLGVGRFERQWIGMHNLVRSGAVWRSEI